MHMFSGALSLGKIAMNAEKCIVLLLLASEGMALNFSPAETIRSSAIWVIFGVGGLQIPAGNI
jgi:hypothetical protein